MESTLNTKRKIGFLRLLSEDTTRISADSEMRSHAWKDEKQTLGQPYTAVIAILLLLVPTTLLPNNLTTRVKLQGPSQSITMWLIVSDQTF